MGWGGRAASHWRGLIETDDLGESVRNGMPRGQIGTVVYRSPGAAVNYRISGVTRDSSGAVLANCRVELFVTARDVAISETVSGADGSFSFDNPGTGPFYLVAYKTGAPDVAGTTVNTLAADIVIAPEYIPPALTNPEIWLAWGDSIGVGVTVREAGDTDWAGVFQVRQRAPTGITADITPLDQAVAPDANSYLSPYEYFGKQRTADIGKDIYLVPHNSNGSSIAPGSWGVGNTFHEAFITRANAAIQTVLASVPNAKVGGIYQIEGSNDTSNNAPATYETALRAAIADMRSRIFQNGVSGANLSALPYIINGLLPDYISTTNRRDYELVLRSVAQSITGGKFLPIPEGFNAGDNLHPSLAGSRYYGTASAGLLTDTSAPIISGIVGTGAYSIYTAQKMQLELSPNEYAWCTLSGAGAADFEIVTLSENTSGIGVSRFKQYLRWNLDGTKAVGTYTVTVVATNGAGLVTNQVLTVNVLAAYGTASTGAVTVTDGGFVFANSNPGNVPYMSPSIALGAGLNLIYTYFSGSVTALNSLSINGIEATLVAGSTAGDVSQIWALPLAQATTGPMKVSTTGNVGQIRLKAVTLTNTVATAASTDNRNVGSQPNPMSSASLTCPTDGVIIGMGWNNGVPTAGTGNTLIAANTVPASDTFFAVSRTTTGSTSINGNGFGALVSAAFAKAP